MGEKWERLSVIIQGEDERGNSFLGGKKGNNKENISCLCATSTFGKIDFSKEEKSLQISRLRHIRKRELFNFHFEILIMAEGSRVRMALPCPCFVPIMSAER